jgi:hypothetical protein
LVASLAGLVLFINFYLLGSFLADSAAPVPHAAWFYALCAAWGVAYLAFLLSLVWAEACALAAAVREWCRPVVAASSEEADSAALDCANPLHPPTFLLVTGS